MPADPTDEAVDLVETADPYGHWDFADIEQLIAAAKVLARVVAGRPDQPTQTTPLAGVVTDHLDASEIAVRLDSVLARVDPLPALGTRVTVYATDPHTPDE